MKNIYRLLAIILVSLTVFGGSAAAQTPDKAGDTQEQSSVKTEADFRALLSVMTSFQARIQAAQTRLAEKGIDTSATQTAIDKTAATLADTKLAIDTFAKTAAIADPAKAVLILKESKAVEANFDLVRQSLIQSLVSLKGALIERIGA